MWKHPHFGEFLVLEEKTHIRDLFARGAFCFWQYFCMNYHSVSQTVGRDPVPGHEIKMVGHQIILV